MIASRKISIQAATALLAAFVAVVLLAAMPSPAAALDWSLPATDLSDGPNNNARGAQVAVGVDGTTTVVWTRSNGDNSIVQARTRPPGSATFGAAVDLSDTGLDAYHPQVAVGDDGTTTVVWSDDDGFIQARTRPAGEDEFGGVVPLSDTVLDSEYPQVGVAVGVDGTTTVVWTSSAGVIQARTRPAGEDEFGAAVDLSDTELDATDPQVAVGVGVDGATTVVWRIGAGVIQASTRPAGEATFGAAVGLSTTAGGWYAYDPQVAVGVDGTTTVVWAIQNSSVGQWIVQANTRPAGPDTSFSGAVDLSAVGSSTYYPQVAVGDDGTTTVVWSFLDLLGNPRIAQASTRPAGGAFPDPDAVPSDVVDLSDAGQRAADAQVAVGDDGATTVVWTSDNGGDNIVQARTRVAGSDTFSAAVDLSAEGKSASALQVAAVGVGGAATVVWVLGGSGMGDSTYLRIQESTSGYLLSLTKSGAGSGSVSSSPAGINCGLVCSYVFSPSTSVTLTASPAAGSSFIGWSGSGCSGTSTCTVTMSAARAVTAEFAVVFDLTVLKSGLGVGTVTSSPVGINCGSACEGSFVDGSSVTLTASPATGSSFTGWNGSGCSGTSTCTVTMSRARAVNAEFTKLPSNNFKMRLGKVGVNALASTVVVPGPGIVVQVGTTSLSTPRATEMAKRAGTMIVCRARKTVAKAGKLTITCRLTAEARAARKQHTLKVRLVTTFTPTGGTAFSITRTLVLKKTGYRPEPVTG